MNDLTTQTDATDAMPVHKSIGAALARAQSEMGKAQKTANNPAFKGEGKPKGTPYATLAGVADACMAALNRHGIAVIQPPFDDETGRYVKTILIHGDTGETLECRVPLIIGKNDMQGFGSAVTYARRFGLSCMAGIAPEDDDGNAAAAAAPKKEAPKPPRLITADQFIALRDKAAAAGVESDKLCAAYEAETLQQFKADAFPRAMARLQATIDAKPATAESNPYDGETA